MLLRRKDQLKIKKEKLVFFLSDKLYRIKIADRDNTPTRMRVRCSVCLRISVVLLEKVFYVLILNKGHTASLKW